MIAASRAMWLRIALRRRPVHLPSTVQHQGVRGPRCVSRLIGGTEDTAAIATIEIHLPAALGNQELIARSIRNFRQSERAGAIVAIKHAIELIAIDDGADAAARPTVVGRSTGLVAARRRVGDRAIIPVF